MRLKESHKRDLIKVIEELIVEYNKVVENDYVINPMAYTLYHLWEKWDAKEHSRISNTEFMTDGKEKRHGTDK